jgi:hypothetical protein
MVHRQNLHPVRRYILRPVSWHSLAMTWNSSLYTSVYSAYLDSRNDSALTENYTDEPLILSMKQVIAVKM